MMWWVEPAIVYMRHYKKPLLIAASVVAVLGGSFGGGVLFEKSRASGAVVRQNEKVIEKVVTEYVERDAVERTVYVRDLEATRKLEAERDRLRALNNQLQYQMDAYVPIQEGSTGAFIPVGAVRLLDRAAQPASAAAAELSPAAPVEADLAPSDLNWRDLARYTVLIAGKYNDTAAQCNALIEWVDTNVVSTNPH